MSLENFHLGHPSFLVDGELHLHHNAGLRDSVRERLEWGESAAILVEKPSEQDA